MKRTIRQVTAIVAFPISVAVAFFFTALWVDYDLNASEAIGLRFYSLASEQEAHFYHVGSASGNFDILGFHALGRNFGIKHSLDSDLHAAFFRAYNPFMESLTR
ncbi:MAG: hypothetical protein MUF31_05600 [Akkermansiaceae bacterium]|jgi:hypothetical protein|nr:hypothetical protein [Akkermansiaceae bacterium]